MTLLPALGKWGGERDELPGLPDATQPVMAQCLAYQLVWGAGAHAQGRVEHGERVGAGEAAGEVERTPRRGQAGQPEQVRYVVQGQRRLMRDHTTSLRYRRPGGHDHVDPVRGYDAEAVQHRRGPMPEYALGRCHQ